MLGLEQWIEHCNLAMLVFQVCPIGLQANTRICIYFLSLTLSFLSHHRSPLNDLHSLHMQVNLRLLLVDGKSHDFLFPLTASSSEISDHVFHNWPEEWNGDILKPDRPEILRLIFRGRFLHNTTTLSGINIMAV